MILRINLFIIVVILFVSFFTVFYLLPNTQIFVDQHLKVGYGYEYFFLAFLNTLLILFLRTIKSKKQNIYTVFLLILLTVVFIYFGFSFFNLQCQCSKEV